MSSLFRRKKKEKKEEAPAVRDNPFLKAIESSMFRHLPNLKILPLASHEPTAVLSGPTKDVAAASYSSLASAAAVSTYPHIPGEPHRMGDPICDQFRINLYENRAIICVTDGCSWGAKVLEAAQRACNAFVNFIHGKLPTITETKQMKSLLIEAVQHAHFAIFEGKTDEDGHWWNVGATTLLGGVLVPIDKGDDRYGKIVDRQIVWSPGYEFICVSVGDCKGFCFTNGQMQDITDLQQRQRSTDARDSGGRLGPSRDDPDVDILHLADLSNFSLFGTPCEEGDLLIFMSDGVHDNLDPQHLGKLPREMPKSMNLAQCDDWDDVDAEKADQAKNIFRIAFLEKQVEGASSPDDLCTTLLDHCVKTTSASRKYMCENNGKIVPKSYAQFPGKMDHSTAACIRVGKFPKLTPAPATNSGATNSSEMLNIGDLDS